MPAAFFEEAIKMIVDIIAVLILVLGFTLSSRLLGYWRGDVLYYVSKPDSHR